MRAAGVTEFGGPEALHIVDVPAEPLGPGQVRLRVQAAAVSPTDTHARSGAYAGRDPVKTPPWVPGMDVAGVVTEVGEGVDHLAVGDPAMGIVLPFGPHGAYPRYARGGSCSSGAPRPHSHCRRRPGRGYYPVCPPAVRHALLLCRHYPRRRLRLLGLCLLRVQAFCH